VFMTERIFKINTIEKRLQEIDMESIKYLRRGDTKNINRLNYEENDLLKRLKELKIDILKE